MPPFTLYDRPDCPYSKRVRRVLDVLDVDYEEVIVPAKREERTDLESITGQRGVPVLVNDNLPEATYTIAPRSRRTSRNTTTDDTHSGDHESDGTQRDRWPQSLYGDFFADDSDYIGAGHPQNRRVIRVWIGLHTRAGASVRTCQLT